MKTYGSCLVAALAATLIAAPVQAAPCGNISSIGCCVGTTAKYCSGGVLKTKDCSKDAKYKKCGWYNKFYTCTSSEKSDPAGKYPRLCSKQPDGGIKPPPKDAGPPKYDKGSGQKCGNITYTGCCVGTIAKYCSKGVLKTKDCAKDAKYKKCGWYNKFYTCTTSDKTDPSNKYPRLCSKQPDGGIKPPDSGTKYDKGSGAACGSVKSQGCCQGNTLKFCNKGKLASKSCGSQKCGWNTTKKYYTCGTSNSADPAGKFPKACGSTTTDSGGTKLDNGSAKQDTGGSAKKDTGGSSYQDSAPNNGGNKKKEDDGCSVAGAPRGMLPLALLGLLALFIRRRRHA